MDHFYAFLIFAVLLVLEQMAANSWLAAYYRLGIPVMVTRKRLALGVDRANRLSPQTFSAGDLAKALQDLFRARPDHPSIRFKALKTRDPARPQIAFHEAWFEPRAGFRYLPITHSLAYLNLEKDEVTIIGYADWYAIFVLIYLVLNTIQDQSFIFIAVIVVIIFGVSYLFQKTVARLVADRMNAILTDEPIPGPEMPGTIS